MPPPTMMPLAHGIAICPPHRQLAAHLCFVLSAHTLQPTATCEKDPAEWLAGNYDTTQAFVKDGDPNVALKKYYADKCKQSRAQSDPTLLSTENLCFRSVFPLRLMDYTFPCWANSSLSG